MHSHPSVDQHLKKLGFISSDRAFDQAAEQIFLRKEGRIRPYQTKWRRLNKMLGGGFQPSTIYTIGGRPGVGKSAIINRLLYDMCEMNDMSNTIFCYWTWEMPGYQQIIRGLSGKMGKTVQELLSAEDAVSDDLYTEILGSRDFWKEHPLYFMSYSRTPEYIYNSMKDVQGLDPGLHIVNIFDHTRLVGRSKDTSHEEAKISRFYYIGQQLAVNFGMTNIYLSQLNRDIESHNRIRRPVPELSDFFGADSVGQFSNIAIILQRPELYSIPEYLGEPTQELMALHILKNRDGDTGWLPLNHNLALNTMSERYPTIYTPTYTYSM